MRVPTIHLNGSSEEALKLPLIEAINSLHAAIRTLSENAPHARDYYVQGDGPAFYEATKEHTDRIQKIAEVRAELCNLVEKIDEQGKPKP
jgi:hypothetical protein